MQIPTTDQHFFLGKQPVFYQAHYCVGQDFWKKNINFSSLKSPYQRLANGKKLILSVEKYPKTLKDMIIGTAGR